MNKIPYPIYLSFIAVFLIVMSIIMTSEDQTARRIRNRKRRKGDKKNMPSEMIREFIGKECTVTLINEIGGCKGKILAVEENWIKFEDKKTIRLLNGDMIRDITIIKK